MCDGSTQAPMNELILSWLNSFNYRHKCVQEAWQCTQELIRRWDSERELLHSAPGSYPNSLK